MIKEATILAVRQRMDIVDVISKEVKLKKSGNGYVGLCPFHDEKSGSFRVNTAKQIYKCFGCGKGGDAITFIMQNEKRTFIEAIEKLAELYNIQLEYDQAAQQVSEERKNEKNEQLQLIAYAQKKYEDLLFSLPAEASAIQYMASRGYTMERMRDWSMGFAPDDWKFLTTPIINMGKHQSAVACGLLSTKEGNSWDFHRNRITIPLHDHNGVLIGLSSRMIPTGDAEKDQELKKYKYLNPCESLVYSKKKFWYGLWQAQHAIKKEEFVYIVEGYLDVQSMHDAGMCNTVASSGTEIDELQTALLKRYTDHAVLFYDGDKTGTEKALKQINLFLKTGFKTSIVSLANGQDPDEFIREYQFTKKDIAA